MKLLFQVVLVVVLVAGVLADKKPLVDPPVAILHSEQHHPDVTGAHSFDFEAENGIKLHVSGSQGENGGANSIGYWSYPLEDGSVASLKFVADEFGYQPQSDLLPVAPEFPHPIPDFVLRQIAFAEAQRAQQSREDYSK
ncbi:cuticle protein AMP2-like isoform X1 [Homarus americanus]|uniref:cuticle protein AMP2-like isoform X1 n=1 Tax=Homarus americanus TaxID=6706 RepID=UPI001C4874C3|nr:cuticle protein AMP2-like isoform X1 [Homarus americanus]